MQVIKTISQYRQLKNENSQNNSLSEVSKDPTKNDQKEDLIDNEKVTEMVSSFFVTNNN